jgi:hypothetical protein
MATTRARSMKKLPARRPPAGRIGLAAPSRIVVLRLKEDLERAPQPLLEAIRKTLHVSSDDLKNAILTRCLSLTWRAMERVPSRILLEAAAASSDQEAMLRILEAPEMAVPDADAAAIDAARARGIEARDQLIHAEGGSWPVEEVAKYLGLTRQAVDKRRKANKLIGLALGRHGYLYPSWQFSKNGTLPGLEDVLQELRRHDPWAQVIFMLSPNDRLDGTPPLRALREGRIDDVKRAASLFGEHGAA